MGRIVHFEIPSDNPQSSIQFYHDVFGWEFSRWGDSDYWMARTGQDSEPGINGAIIKRRNDQQPLTNTIEVDDLEETIEEIEDKGGQIVVPKISVEGVGWLAFFMDPEGIIMGAVEPDPRAK
ncbi:MAG: VOC family protein [Bacteroidota bacterium]